MPLRVMSARRNASGFLGLLMLDTRFPRLPGDVGHLGSWQMPVRCRVVAGAAPKRVVQQADEALIDPFIAAARELVADGAAAITTSCGFLVRWQREIAAAVPVPVWTSSLLALAELPSPGVLTVDATSLGERELSAAGAALDTPVQGLAPGCGLRSILLDDLPLIDGVQAQADAVAAACTLVAQAPQVRHIVLECTNLPPYASAIALATGRPVHHLMTLVQGRWETL
jgi:hypothetical protein